ncbi:hypothetical protein [Amycolatopsis sp. SID8362]|uniref:hypothetical protein n=1 Tax=Amycolatopsis sp. SID8362 TaxID=2690346 RepID=UPI00136F3075|nr:hypothetical protein [Amycolatopsis sp. SID8362]NBH02903.1 hypothetical protein [Amycolatopsis sp. SID8362]NED39604.1 hypothetical protein [Amycolatopsis sp. SID8362]
MTTNEVILDLLERYVLRAGEGVERVRRWPDGVAVTTSAGRHLVAGSEAASWSVSREAWVADVVEAVRDDIIVNGGGNPAERHGFLLLADGRDVYVNDAAAVAELGRRLEDGLDPTAYAEILAEFHPYTSAVSKVLSTPDQLRLLIGHEDIPDIEPPRVERTATGLVLTFSSIYQYRWPVEGPLLDLAAWTVRVPRGCPARWETRRVAQRIRLAPHPGIGGRLGSRNSPVVDREDTMASDASAVQAEADRIADLWRDDDRGAGA